jgi:type I restriction-modification system DNA methylase subunit
MVGLPVEVVRIRENLLHVGFREDRLLPDFPIPPGGEKKVSLLAFSDHPFDSRTASVAVVQARHPDDSGIAALRPLGAPLVFACLPDHYQFWTQGAARPVFQRRFTAEQIAKFFEDHREKLAPASIYRAKVWGRLEPRYQLDFVDAGLMPLVEEEAGNKLTQLVERVVASTKKRLGWMAVSDTDGRWLLKSTFWLLAAKILRDKEVPGFKRLNLTEVEEVYERLARHYNSESPQPLPVGGGGRRDALVAAAETIGALGNCRCVSTEALSHLYESALIDRITRSKLGTHSTPTWLVDYIVGKLRPWIENDIPAAARRVFEPACGHAAFLISAMRLLTELLPSDWQEPRRSYLRQRLHGLEIDPFALEIARLSLTLADVPNPNGWALTEANMFAGDRFEQGARSATIVLGNPPFEDFGVSHRHRGWLPNKAAEAFRRVVEHLQPGSVFGFVLPQTFLRSKQGIGVRRTLLSDFEVAEVSLFADKVFHYGDAESAVLIGRRIRQGDSHPRRLRFERVREGQVGEFSHTYQPSSADLVPLKTLTANPDTPLFVPDLNAVWGALSGTQELGQFAEVAQGLMHRSQGDPKRPRNAITESEVELAGLVPGFAGWKRGQVTNGLPRTVFLNLNPAVVRRPGSGTTTGVAQVLLNYAPVSRGPWRLKALLDAEGHPVTSRFLTVRPRSAELPLEALWAVLNSPVGNAFAYCHSEKRDNLSRDMRRMPVPDLSKADLRPLRKAVVDYLTAARGRAVEFGRTTREEGNREDSWQRKLFPGAAGAETPTQVPADEGLRLLHWRIDAEVVRLYDLPPEMERRLLDLFTGVQRRGVPFEQTEYFRKDFTDLDRLCDLLAITADWPKTNRRRAKLIDLEEEGRLTPAQREELEELQRLADASVSLFRPVQMERADELIDELKRVGLWEEAN